MNMQICFRNRTLSKAQTLYLTSRFFRWTNADNILHEVLEATDGLPQKLMIVLSMDGPNTSSKVYENFEWDFKLRKNYLCWERITQNYWCCPCGLHVVHAALQTGMKLNGWKLEKVLKAMWKLFNDSPAWRDLYIQLNTSNVLPLMFCQTCWVEVEPVAMRAMEVWEIVVNVIKYFQPFCKSKQPSKNNLYDTLVTHHTDMFMKEKLHFFVDAASMSLYLKQFQADNPMILFVSKILKNLICWLMKIFIIDEADPACSLIEIDFQKQENHLPLESVKLPTAIKILLLSIWQRKELKF